MKGGGGMQLKGAAEERGRVGTESTEMMAGSHGSKLGSRKSKGRGANAKKNSQGGEEIHLREGEDKSLVMKEVGLYSVR